MSPQANVPVSEFQYIRSGPNGALQYLCGRDSCGSEPLALSRRENGSRAAKRTRMLQVNNVISFLSFGFVAIIIIIIIIIIINK